MSTTLRCLIYCSFFTPYPPRVEYTCLIDTARRHRSSLIEQVHSANLFFPSECQLQHVTFNGVATFGRCLLYLICLCMAHDVDTSTSSIPKHNYSSPPYSLAIFHTQSLWVRQDIAACGDGWTFNCPLHWVNHFQRRGTQQKDQTEDGFCCTGVWSRCSIGWDISGCRRLLFRCHSCV